MEKRNRYSWSHQYDAGRCSLDLPRVVTAAVMSCACASIMKRGIFKLTIRWFVLRVSVSGLRNIINGVVGFGIFGMFWSIFSFSFVYLDFDSGSTQNMWGLSLFSKTLFVRMYVQSTWVTILTTFLYLAYIVNSINILRTYCSVMGQSLYVSWL